MSTGVLYGGPDAIVNGGGVPTAAVTARITAAMSVTLPSVPIAATVSAAAGISAAAVVALAGNVDGNAAASVAATVTAVAGMGAREVTATVSGTASITAVAQLFVAGSYPDEVLTDAPATYLRLGEANGTTFADSSGNGRVGTSAGNPTLGVAGVNVGDSDTAVTFDGADDLISIPGYSAFWPGASQGITLEAWYKGTFVGSTSTTHPGALIAANNNSTDKRWALSIDNNGKAVGITDANYIVTGPSSTRVNDNAWHHVVLTIAASTYDTVLYVDGVSEATSTTPNDAGGGSPAIVTIGRNPRGTLNSGYLSGTIDEVAIYSTVLSAARVLAHYNAAGNRWSPAAVSVAASVTVAAVVV